LLGNVLARDMIKTIEIAEELADTEKRIQDAETHSG